MKKFLLASFVTLCLGGLAGCSSQQVRGDAPLKTEGTTTPPPGCVDLRRRGGAC